MKTIPKKYAETRIEEYARRWMNSRGRDYDNGAEGAYADLMHGGCASGVVGELVYYTDTLRFYRRYADEINAMLRESMTDMGVDNPSELFGSNWDDSDPLARDTHNRNLLAWFGFEEAARNVASRAGIEC